LIKGMTRGHKEAFSEAFKIVYNIDTTIDIIEHSGMSDQQVIIEVLKKNGLDKQKIKSRMIDCMKVMIESFNKVIEQEKIVVLDGVKELLEELNKHNVLVGLVTGNLEPIARSKLKKVGLNHYFKVGGFGTDDINRVNLVKIAIKRAEKNFDFKLKNNVFFIGDNPREIKAAKEVGVRTIGTATGIFSMKELKNTDTDFVLKNLKDTNRILKIILL